ncbi:uncharacterized protein B0T15DRAFT_68377 [Chaetomium strumarium]|uniref:Uncharacterized protein n=1 Tax=Chaetomium strumarium TaxID=1170767 RepID=A0AAJ0H3Q6_9PEZI|nr:hypothetical protein B0T15DRAFT_68377 [Chaetomium strumarium]
MRGLSVATNADPATAKPRRSSNASRTSSPPRPPVSPITPPLGPARLPPHAAPSTGTDRPTVPDFARGRPSFTHTTQTEQVGVVPPPAPPIDFETNPDVIALKSAISILQLQRARATADIQTLSRAKEAALADPEAFIADLQAGRIRTDGDPLFPGRGRGSTIEEDSDDDSDSNDDKEGEEEDERGNAQSEEQADWNETEPRIRSERSKPDGASRSHLPSRSSTGKGKAKQKPDAEGVTGKPPPWQTLPKPQTIVRCPPINWAQYGVVGESLDKLHAEQLAAPTPGAPMILGPGGTYEFKAGGSGGGGSAAAAAGGGSEQGGRLVGIAAPYNPLRDKLEKKGKAGKR